MTAVSCYLQCKNWIWFAENETSLKMRQSVAHSEDKSLTTENHPAGEHRAGVFATTHWSVVIAAGQGESPAMDAALEHLSQTYWYPLYVYVRRKGYNAEDAQDLTQGFFTKLLQKNYLNRADRNRGRFRSFLLGALEHYLAREWTRANAQKRGGGQRPASLDEMDGAARYLHEPAHTLTPEKIFDRRWATTLLEQAMTRLHDDYAARGQSEIFDRLKGLLSGDAAGESYAKIGGGLKTSEGAVRVAVHRLRQRYGEMVRAEIAETVTSPAEVDEELAYLFAALRD